MKHFLYFITVISIAVVQFASAHTFPECPKQDEEIRFKKNSILYLKSYLDDPDFRFENFVGSDVRVERNDGVYFHLMPNKHYSSLDGEVCIASYTDSNGKSAVGFFNLVQDEVTHFLPGYGEGGDSLSFRGQYQNEKKHGYWEYYYIEEENGYHKGELKSFGFYNNGERDGIWFEFPVRTWHRPHYLSPAIISYNEGQKHGPFLDLGGQEVLLKHKKVSLEMIRNMVYGLIIVSG